MLKKKIFGSSTWIDLESPTPQEVDEAIKLAGVDESIAEDLVAPSTRHKIEFGENHASIILHFPAYRESRNGDAAYEVDIIITKHVIITTHYGEIEALDKLEPNDESEKELFFEILNALITNFERKLSSIDHSVRDIEKKMFSGKEKIAVYELSEASHHLTDFKKITAVYPEAFATIEFEGQRIFGKKFAQNSHIISERIAKTSSKLAVLSEWTKELRETNSALLNIKQNEIMKLLTILTFVSDIFIGLALIYLAIHGQH